MKVFNLESTKDIEKASKYDGFISPDGDFFMVSKKHAHKPTHTEWAEKYILNKTNFIKDLANPSGSLLYTLTRLKDKQDVLIHYYGFVYYGHNEYTRKPIIIYPNIDINDKEISKNQERFLWDLLYENNETDYFPKDKNENLHNEEHDKYVDSLLERLIINSYKGGK